MYQSGFRKKHSTITATMKVLNDITEAVDKKQHCISLFIDLIINTDKTKLMVFSKARNRPLIFSPITTFQGNEIETNLIEISRSGFGNFSFKCMQLVVELMGLGFGLNQLMLM